MMDPTSDALYAAASLLPEADRLALAARLLEDLPVQGILLSLDDDDLVGELDRRRDEESGAVPWSRLQAEP